MRRGGNGKLQFGLPWFRGPLGHPQGGFLEGFGRKDLDHCRVDWAGVNAILLNVS